MSGARADGRCTGGDVVPRDHRNLSDRRAAGDDSATIDSAPTVLDPIRVRRIRDDDCSDQGFALNSPLLSESDEGGLNDFG